MALYFIAFAYSAIASFAVIATFVEGRQLKTSSIIHRAEGMLLALCWPLLIMLVMLDAVRARNVPKNTEVQLHLRTR
ncbi:hypothetical protein [Aliirhizobium smilacinae]|uniref:Uncharacterized protein n=1 Tax=Aliirhizobium smilacinae TaxID=1395944 RepID=A0A5C4XPY4_9HYPH|nr:hypothetical protein [Rhizobium smilacinae]TNM65368.1 hypothetical protein FHP24_03585 [Rhizobium smilacinae]